MTYDLKRWRAHPGRNPEHDPRGPRFRYRRVRDQLTGRMRTARIPNPSRWLPHQGTAEKARRAARTGGVNV